MQFSHLTILALAATALAAPSALEARNGGGKKGGSGGGGGSSSSPQCTGSQSMMCCKGGIDNLVGIGCVSILDVLDCNNIQLVGCCNQHGAINVCVAL